jgi:hypothetical protein
MYTHQMWQPLHFFHTASELKMHGPWDDTRRLYNAAPAEEM